MKAVLNLGDAFAEEGVRAQINFDGTMITRGVFLSLGKDAATLEPTASQNLQLAQYTDTIL